jgi:hypothetical protein
MQEYAWLHGSDYRDMVGVVGTEPSPRKMGLAACACARSGWHEFSDPRLLTALETAEDYAEFRATKERLKAAKRSLADLLEEARARQLQDKAAVPERAWADPEHDAWWGLFGTNRELEQQVRLIELVLKPSRVDADTLLAVGQTVAGLRFPNQPRLCELLRDIFGNPFRPVTFPPEWRTDTVVTLARQAYELREFSAMPIMADALQDAGCDSEAILSHCRDTNQLHVRGCWVVDSVLGKE